MKFAIITHVLHKKLGNQYFAYAPYVREMNVWAKYVTEFMVVGAVKEQQSTPIDSCYSHPSISFFEVDTIDVLTWKTRIITFFKLPKIAWQIFKAMYQADHIHLRCPGNIGLLGCFVQILFPNKSKTAKYAGNWDPKAKQPWSYRLQKWLLSNSFLTRNMQVLVYGEWEGSSKNIHPFFTATYWETEKAPLKPLNFANSIRLVFVGTLSEGKRPMYAIALVEALSKRGYAVQLELYGEGKERVVLEDYIEENHLKSFIELKGNQSKEIIKSAYQSSHFVLLPSKSEGWPKAIAEGMFWGCVPLATSISCVPFMLDYGNRGVVLTTELEEDVLQISGLLQDERGYWRKREQASEWSRKYTLDVFEKEIEKMVSGSF
ncbi:glycosyltransferase [Flavobacterium sp.]|jgi:glycosyltransferase involved in cell wall biosynthesis|uniref:glycosyltransferase family 4 protein n=1 Tax=Flavobacterium sp. TaxID=239 RepID=UPI0022C47FFB|nr:glycosyltransferase [Flavobacterium sp.]MCZ8229359.1 glycosyltransferase [Flavobacterium sp.]